MAEHGEADPAPLVAVALPRAPAADAVRALWDGGRAVLPLDPDAPPAANESLVAHLRPTHLLDGRGTHPLAGGTPVPPGTAAVVATSGTTGAPKGVQLTFRGLEASARAVTAALAPGPGDGWLCCLPVHHVAGLAIVARSWVTGARLAVHDRFDPGALTEHVSGGSPVTARAKAPTPGGGGGWMVSLVPTMLARLLDAQTPVERFARILLGGGPVPEQLRRRAGDAGAALVTTYGMTETWGGVVHDGHVVEGAEVQVAGGGELLVRGPMVTTGYRFDPELTATALRDGWLHTGDAGAIGSDGTVRVVDRMDDLVISGGVNVSPTEVEAVLASHPALADVCVAGAPDPDWGERVVAWIVPRPGVAAPSLDELRAFAADRLPAAKLPRQVVVTGAVPRTPGGKPRRSALPHP